jgi:hypothetical protein|tara:strand:- start:238 stop:549 length:312 start_codon:yes stop_codon:yes gene_type:complete
MVSSLLSKQPAFYQLTTNKITSLSVIDKDLLVQHPDSSLSFLSNSFTSIIASAASNGGSITKKDSDSDSGFSIDDIRYLIMPGAVLCVYIYQVYFKAPAKSKA